MPMKQCGYVTPVKYTVSHHFPLPPCLIILTALNDAFRYENLQRLLDPRWGQMSLEELVYIRELNPIRQARYK